MWAIIVLEMSVLGFCVGYIIREEKKTQREREAINQICSRCHLYEPADTEEEIGEKK